jgi:hypothetical protein
MLTKKDLEELLKNQEITANSLRTCHSSIVFILAPSACGHRPEHHGDENSTCTSHSSSFFVVQFGPGLLLQLESPA